MTDAKYHRPFSVDNGILPTAVEAINPSLRLSMANHSRVHDLASRSGDFKAKSYDSLNQSIGNDKLTKTANVTSANTSSLSTSTSSSTSSSSNAQKKVARVNLNLKNFESPYSLMQKFLREQNIYSDPNDNYKRRTIVLTRSKPSTANSSVLNSNVSSSSSSTSSSSSSSSSSKFKSSKSSSELSNLSSSRVGKSTTDNNGGEFGFNLQAYGMFNKYTSNYENICFVRKVEPDSAAKRAGLNNGDALLALDGITIDKFKSFAEIVNYIKSKNEIRLVVMAEQVCKKIQLQLKMEHIKKLLAEKKALVDTLNSKQESILKKLTISNEPNNHSNEQISSKTDLTESSSSSSSSSSVIPVSSSQFLDSFLMNNLLKSNNSSLTNSSCTTSTNSASENATTSSSISLANNNNNNKSDNQLLTISPNTNHMIESTRNESSAASLSPSSTASQTWHKSGVGNMETVGDQVNNHSILSSESVLSAASLSVVSSNSSSSSSSSCSSSLLNGKNETTLKTSSPIDEIGSKTNSQIAQNTHSTSTSPDSKSVVFRSTQKPTLDRSSSSSYIVKQPKANNSTNKDGNKDNRSSISLAKKYFQTTSRLVRSASSSSMNLFSNLKNSLSSSNLSKGSSNVVNNVPAPAADLPSNSTSKKASKKSNNNNNNSIIINNINPNATSAVTSRQNRKQSSDLRAIRHSISTDYGCCNNNTNISYDLTANANKAPKTNNKLILKDATLGISSTDEVNINTTVPAHPPPPAPANSRFINYNTNGEERFSQSDTQKNLQQQLAQHRLSNIYSSDRVVKLNNHYEYPNNYNSNNSNSKAKNKNLLTKLNANSLSLDMKHSDAKSNQMSGNDERRQLFTILTNKPKLNGYQTGAPRKYMQPPPPPSSNSSNLVETILNDPKSVNSGMGLVSTIFNPTDTASVRNQATRFMSNADETSTASTSTSTSSVDFDFSQPISAHNHDEPSRINPESNGDFLLNVDHSPFNRSISYPNSSSDESAIRHYTGRGDAKNTNTSSIISYTQIPVFPVVDNSNEDYVITRL